MSENCVDEGLVAMYTRGPNIQGDTPYDLKAHGQWECTRTTNPYTPRVYEKVLL